MFCPVSWIRIHFLETPVSHCRETGVWVCVYLAHITGEWCSLVWPGRLMPDHQHCLSRELVVTQVTSPPVINWFYWDNWHSYTSTSSVEWHQRRLSEWGEVIVRDCCNVWRVWTASGPWCPGLTPLTQQFLQWEQRPSLLLLVTSKWQSKYFSSLDAGQYEPATSQVQSTFPLKTFYSNKTWLQTNFRVKTRRKKSEINPN